MSWIEDLKEGDIVIISIGAFRGTPRKVDRITKTMIKIGSYKFKKDGSVIGDYGYSYPMIEEATEEAITEIKIDQERRGLKNKLLERIKKDISLEKLRAVMEILGD